MIKKSYYHFRDIPPVWTWIPPEDEEDEGHWELEELGHKQHFYRFSIFRNRIEYAMHDERYWAPPPDGGESGEE